MIQSLKLLEIHKPNFPHSLQFPTIKIGIGVNACCWSNLMRRLVSMQAISQQVLEMKIDSQCSGQE